MRNLDEVLVKILISIYLFNVSTTCTPACICDETAKQMIPGKKFHDYYFCVVCAKKMKFQKEHCQVSIDVFLKNKTSFTNVERLTKREKIKAFPLDVLTLDVIFSKLYLRGRSNEKRHSASMISTTLNLKFFFNYWQRSREDLGRLFGWETRSGL